MTNKNSKISKIEKSKSKIQNSKNQKSKIRKSKIKKSKIQNSKIKKSKNAKKFPYMEILNKEIRATKNFHLRKFLVTRRYTNFPEMEITFYIWYVTRTQDSKNRKIKNSKFENQKIKIQKFKIQKLKNQKFKIQKKKFALFNQTVHRIRSTISHTPIWSNKVLQN